MKKFFLSLSVTLVFAAYASSQNFSNTFLNPTSVIAVQSNPITTPEISGSGSPKQTRGANPGPASQPQPKQKPITLPLPTPSPTPTPRGLYKDGTYTGNVADAFYGNVQVQVAIANGKISNVIFLNYPQDRGRSVAINTQAMPFLKAEAIQAQNATVDIVSGATATSEAFRQSLASALVLARS